jgi:hypothetical protein
VARRVLHQDVPCPASLSFNAVRRLRADLRVRRVLRCVRASAGRCIPRGRRLREHVRWVWGQRFRLRALHGREAVRVVRRGGLVNAMFRVA